jgi:putative PIG3 family NAD(P)H quinone oxidoreductase
MRKIVHGPDTPLALAVVARPEPSAGEILIRVAAAGVNRPDLMQRAGLYAPPPGAPETLGLEVAGEVISVGAGVSRWREGDQVCALLPGGGYAEYALAPEGSALPIPNGLSLIEAAALPETVFTVWANVFETAALKPREVLLVHGGASGIGTTAIQMAKAHGARVFTTAGDDAKCALCRKLGADRAINYRTEDFETVVGELGGADVVLDMVGGPYVQKNLNLLNDRGRCVMIAFLKGPQTELNLMRLMLKRLTLTGSTLRPRTKEEKARIAREVERVVWPWIGAGKVRPVIDSTFPLADAEAAHARLQSGVHAGKIVLIP